MPREVKWAISLAGRPGPAGVGLEVLFCARHAARLDLRPVDHRGLAAKRRGGGPGGSIWRGGQPDSIRSARRRNVSFEGDDLVRDHVHADVDGVDDAPEHGRLHLRGDPCCSNSRRRRSSGCSCGSCSPRPGSGNACANHTGAVEVSASGRASGGCILGSQIKIVSSSPTCGSGGTGRRTILRGWRRKAWGFESPLPHQLFYKAHRNVGFFFAINSLQTIQPK